MHTFITLKKKCGSKYLAKSIFIQANPEYCFNRVINKTDNTYLAMVIADYLTEFKPVYEKWLGNFLKGGKSAKYLILTNLARKLKYTIDNGILLRILGSNNVELADEILQDIGSGFYIGWVKRETVRNLDIFGIWMEIGKESVAAMKECVLTKGSGKVLKCFFAIDKPTLEDFKICAENNVFGNFRRLWKLSDKKNIVQIADLAYDAENTSFREFMVKKLRKRKIFYVADLLFDDVEKGN